MISCNRDVIDISGSVIDIKTDLTCIIHAIDQVFTEQFDKDFAFNEIKECYEVAMSTRSSNMPKVEDETNNKPNNKPNNAFTQLLDAFNELARVVNEVQEEEKNGSSK